MAYYCPYCFCICFSEEGKKVQFAAMENAGFWWWTFTLKDSNGDVLGVIDRDFRGLGLEVISREV